MPVKMVVMLATPSERTPICSIWSIHRPISNGRRTRAANAWPVSRTSSPVVWVNLPFTGGISFTNGIPEEGRRGAEGEVADGEDGDPGQEPGVAERRHRERQGPEQAAGDGDRDHPAVPPRLAGDEDVEGGEHGEEDRDHPEVERLAGERRLEHPRRHR